MDDLPFIGAVSSVNPDDTIVAISSPPGTSARGIVRLSGSSAIGLARSLLRSEAQWANEDRVPSWQQVELNLDEHSLPASFYRFPSPRSYTGQDIVEIHTVGSPVLLGMLVELLLARGARRAEPGEFTLRAYLAGKLDLSQVHAVAGMIAARSDSQLRAAERLLHGVLSKRAADAREELADLLSLVEGAMDFADEPIEFITPPELLDRLARLEKLLTATIDAGLRAERWDRLPRVILAGAPNAGKSSLLNRLTGLDRAICTALAGTTRDVLSAPLSLGDAECLLLDAAGFDPDAVGLEAQAQQAARLALRDADLILHVMDASVSLRRQSGLNAIPNRDLQSRDQQSRDREGAVGIPEDARHGFQLDVPYGSNQLSNVPSESIPCIVVFNKSDQLDSRAMDAHRDSMMSVVTVEDGAPPFVFVSALTGQGCDELKHQIASALSDRDTVRDDATIALMADHRESLDGAVEAVRNAIRLAGRQNSASGESDAGAVGGNSSALPNADLIAAELRSAASSLGVIAGADQTEDLLGRIFSRFCVGK